MKQRILTLLLLLALLPLATACGITRVEAGYTGIKVKLAGDDRGVTPDNIVTGWVFYNPMSTQVFEFPTFMQQFAWTQASTTDSPGDDSVTFNSKEGVVLNADVFVAYAFDPQLVPHVFQEFRVDADTITHTFVRNQVREAINRVAQTMPVIQIYGDGKAKITDAALLDLQTRLAPRGFIFDALAFVGEMRVPDNVKASINKVITAQNEAAEAQARVAQREFEAAQNVALAQGDYDAAVLRAKANRELAASVTPELVQYMNAKALEAKWDGKLPTFAGGNAIPLIQLPNK